ncbi:MAG TPA: ABC transporter substrate-binding protein, partial [Pseudoflavonifractor sp.]|nr:ABC transporter substrate-binding protein [Pseudoflavonifractor sp.]
SATVPAERTKVNLAVLKGNTGMSAVKLLSDNEEGTTANDYAVTIAAAPDEVTGKLINGDLDIAALPTNVAATLYNKTDGGVQMLAVCGLGVLYVLEKGDTVHSVADLAGKTLYATGQGANPEYVLNYLLKQNGLEAGKDVTVEWKTADELSTLMASGEIDLAMMPVPAATGVVMKNPDVRFALDFTKEWDAVADHGVLTMSCVAVRTAFAQEHPEAVNAFLKEYAASVDYVKNNVEAGAELVAKYEITPNAKIAAAAIPQINLIYVDGEEMRDSIQGYFEVLSAADPKSIGGGIPADDFYYVG